MNNIIRIALFLFLLEELVMLAITQLGISESFFWQIALLDATAVALIAVPSINFWLLQGRGLSRFQINVAAVKSAAIIFYVEAMLMTSFGDTFLTLPDWKAALLDGFSLAVITSPIIYYWSLKPLMDEGHSDSTSMPIGSGVALAVLISSSVFLFDLSIPLGVAAGVPYIALVLIGLWFPHRKAPVVLAVIASILVVAGYYLSESSGMLWMVLTNRGLALFAIWVTALLVMSQKTDMAQLQLLYLITADTNSNKDHDEILRQVLEDVCLYTGWSLGHICFSKANAPGEFISSNIWYSEDKESFSPFVKATSEAVFATGGGFVRRVLESSESVWVNDLQNSPDFSRSRAATVVGLKSGCAVPIREGKNVVAVMEFFSRKTERPDGSMIKLLKDAGLQLGRIFERKRAEQQLSHMANHDPLTGLPNLNLGRDRLSAAIAIARRNSGKSTSINSPKMALMFIDLDGFKLVNDTLGHDVGDQLLKEVSARFSSCIREVDTVARVGGDEFIIILTNSDGREAAKRVAHKIIDAVDIPFELQEHHVSIGVSIGIAIYPDHGEEPEMLLKKADEAMYLVKDKGKNNYAFVSE